MPAKPNEVALRSRSNAEWVALASNYQDEGHYRDAIRSYLRILELDQTQSIETTLGVLYELCDEPEQSLAEHHRAIRKNRSDAASHAGLAGLLKRLGNEDNARGAISRARSHVNPSTSYYTMACIEAIDGDVDEALEFLSCALKETPHAARWAKSDPDLLSLRDLPPVEDLVSSS